MEKSALKQLIKRAVVTDKYTIIRNLCKDRKVLDVGCIGQDFTANASQWLHHEIKNVAAHVTGVDIAVEEMEKLNMQGYHILQISQLESLNENYEVVVMADVIEHVSDPVEFLRFYSRFLKEDGIMIVSTPNANRAINFLSILFFNSYSVNDEHTCWYCPRTLQEVIMRAGLQVNEFYWLKRYYKNKGLNFTTRILTSIADILSKCRRNYHQNFMVILSK